MPRQTEEGRMATMPHSSPLPRRAALRAIAGLGALGLAGRAHAANGDVPPGTSLVVADPPTQIYLQAAGGMGTLPFTPHWANLWVGPEMLQAYRARAIDIGIMGGIPPLVAGSTGLDLKIIGVSYRPPTYYALATAPGSGIRALSDLKGRKIAFSAGQEEGLFVLQLLKQLGLGPDQVTLTRLTIGEFLNALASRQVDAAPMQEPKLTTYITRFAGDGAIALRPSIPATPHYLTVAAETLKDRAKAAAVRRYVAVWYAAGIWAWEHNDAWIDAFYIRSQHVTKADGQRIVDALGRPAIPRNWTRALQMEREADDLLAGEKVVGKLDVATLYDRGFEPIAAKVVPDKYLVD